MHVRVIFRILGFLLVMFSTTLLPPLTLSLIAADGATPAFLSACAITAFIGILCWFPVRFDRTELGFRDGFLIVVLFWTVLALIGAVPLYLSENPAMSITDAFFESMSGLTTTGATVLTGIDDLPMSIRYYRQQLQWLGGMGIIVLAVAVMPMLGVGGMQLYRAETPGPIKDSKLTPRIAETAKALWYLYLGLTAVCALTYWALGMSLFDAICHAFSTVAIGGFSTHDLSLGYFQSNAINSAAIVFMVVSGINFTLHFSAFRDRSLRRYANDTEVMNYLYILGAAAVITILMLLANGTFTTAGQSINSGLFHVVSIATTTGFTTANFSIWPTFVPYMLMMLSVVGGCAGSTAGGMKVIRIILLYKQGRREIAKLVHPNAIIPIKLSGRAVPDNVASAVWGFLALYIFTFVLLSMALLATGADPITAFSAITACMNNLGPGLGEVAYNYANVPATGKWILSVAMLLGRLELFTLLVLLTRTFWRG